MSIEDKIDELIEAITDNTIAVNKLCDLQSRDQQPSTDESENEEETTPATPKVATKKAAKKKASRKKGAKKSSEDDLKAFHVTTRELLKKLQQKLFDDGADSMDAAKKEVLKFMDEETGVRRLDAITAEQFPTFIEALEEVTNG